MRGVHLPGADNNSARVCGYSPRAQGRRSVPKPCPNAVVPSRTIRCQRAEQPLTFQPTMKSMLLSKLSRGCVAAITLVSAALLTQAAQAAVVLQVDSGILNGATGITVGSLSGTYSVQFVDSTCAAVFGACDVANFAFITQADARAASQALLDLVFIDSAAGAFDSTPNLTFGCLSTTSCRVWTPYDIDSFFNAPIVIAVRNRAAGSSADQVASPFSALSSNTAEVGDAVWARWSIDAPVAQVPEPGTLALVALSAAALGCTRRRRSAGAEAR